MKLRVKSDGTVPGTRVETEDGQLVHRVQGVRWEASVNQQPTVTLRLVGSELDVVADVGSEDLIRRQDERIAGLLALLEAERDRSRGLKLQLQLQIKRTYMWVERVSELRDELVASANRNVELAHQSRRAHEMWLAAEDALRWRLPWRR